MTKEVWEYLQAKRLKVLDAIMPIMQAFEITNYDYIIKEDLQKETLRIGNTYICCSCNSIEAIINEILKYLIVKRDVYLGAFDSQSKKRMKQYWLSEEAKKRNGFIKEN